MNPTNGARHTGPWPPSLTPGWGPCFFYITSCLNTHYATYLVRIALKCNKKVRAVPDQLDQARAWPEPCNATHPAPQGAP